MQNITKLRVLIPSDKDFSKYEDQIKDLYEKSQANICDTNSYEFVRDNTLFYVFFLEEKFIGIIYYFLDDNKLFFNGCSTRKSYPVNVECIKLSSTWFVCNIYAEAQNRASALCLLKAGFKKTSDNLFIFEQ